MSLPVNKNIDTSFIMLNKNEVASINYCEHTIINDVSANVIVRYAIVYIYICILTDNSLYKLIDLTNNNDLALYFSSLSAFISWFDLLWCWQQGTHFSTSCTPGNERKKIREGERERQRNNKTFFVLPMLEHTLCVTLIFDLYDSTTEILYTYVFHMDLMIIVGFLSVSLNQLVLYQVHISMWSIECILLLLLLLLLLTSRIYLPTILTE
jgi:hypothetical protein